MEPKLAKAFAALTTGIYVLTVAEGDRHHGMSSSWVTQASGEPPLFSASVDNHHFSHGIIQRTGCFGLNVVGARGKQLEDYFYSASAKRPDNLSDSAYELSPILRVPWLRDAMIAIEARVVASHVAGDHTIFIAEPAGILARDPDRPLSSQDLEYVYLGGRTVMPIDRSGW